MSLRMRLAAAGFAAAMLVSPALAQATPLLTPQQPAVTAFVLPQAPQSQTAVKAADWLAAQWEAEPAQLSGGQLADAMAGIAATGTHPEVLKEMDTKLRSQVGAYVTNAGNAGKTALAAQWVGSDPRDYGGKDLIAFISERLSTDPAAEGIYNLPYAVIALANAGETVPEAAIQAMLDLQKPEGPIASDWGVEYDMTGLWMVALKGIEGKAGSLETKVTEAIAKAHAWALKEQGADGSWPGFSPVNTTAFVGQGVIAAGGDPAKARAYLDSMQGPGGGLLYQDAENIMATAQALPLMMGLTYTDLPSGSPEPTEPAPTEPAPSEPAPTQPAPTEPAPTPPEPSVDPTAEPTAPTTAPSTPPAKNPGKLPETGADR